MEDLFAMLDRLVEDFDLDRIEHVALEALPGAEGDDAIDLWSYLAWARFEQGRMQLALQAAQQGGDRLLEAKALFHLWKLEEALDALDALGTPEEPDEAAEVEWYRGLLAEFGGKSGDENFRAAARLAPDLFREPVRLTEGEIDAVVSSAVADLPPVVRRVVEETVIEVRPLPRPYPDVDPFTLGLYIGRDRMQRSLDGGPELPPRIEIYQSNIERMAYDREEAIDELRITLLHEIAHHLGFDEPDVERLGLG